ncbi:DUF461 domain-containing protein [Streptomyces sp. TRM43335]|uniref:DUF461 domain-containing protein n=1 Tax=Streptomyces taklimakanensis TaxID=2569853 RepID=A0A6G2BC80_9ACTN|nr:DUF461 domain-containing protein [Streptomyces taklimakanensis]MTE19679.1 DUF461 domain-containing protein [Streptomyces taklimakanensis]
MSSSLRRGALAASAIALSIASLTACGAGPNAQSLNINPDNASAQVDDLKVQNVNVITSQEDGGSASVSARVFNEGSEDETLESITVDGREVELSPAQGREELTVPAGGSLVLGGEGNAAALIDDPSAADINNGEAQPLVFEFSSTGRVELRATVVPAEGTLAQFGPSGSPSPTDQPTEGAEATPDPSIPARSEAPGEPGEEEDQLPEDEGANDSGDDDTQGEIGGEENDGQN